MGFQKKICCEQNANLFISISITGLVVLGGHTRVHDPHANFRDSFSGTTGNGYGLSNALVKINFAYAGYNNAFNVVNEVKVYLSYLCPG